MLPPLFSNFDKCSSDPFQTWQRYSWKAEEVQCWVWGVNSFSGIFFWLSEASESLLDITCAGFLGTLPLRLLVDSPMVFTRLSESLASGLDLEVTEIQTCLIFVVNGSKVWISKSYIALFRKYCTHKLGCPPCLLTCWGDNNPLSAFYGWGVKTVSDQKYMDIAVDRIKPPCVFAHILLASRYGKLWASCGEWLDPRPAACSWLPSP